MRWSRVVLGGASGLLVLVLFALFVTGQQAHANIFDAYFQVDGAGARTESFGPEAAWSMRIAGVYANFGDQQWLLTGVGLAALALIAFALWRIDRKREIRLVAIVAPLLALVAIGLTIGMLGHYRYDDLMVSIHTKLSSVPATYESDGLCTVWIERCSRMIVWDTMRAIAFALASVALGGVALAARLAWRAGQRGHALGRPGQAAALGVFVLGCVALVSTRGHREAREQTMASCAQPDGFWPQWAEDRAHWSVEEIEPVVVDSCSFEPWTALLDGELGTYVGELELLATGAVYEFPTRRIDPLTEAELRDHIAAGLDGQFEDLDWGLRTFDPHARVDRADVTPVAVVTLYVDAQTPGPILAERLRQLARMGIRDVLVIGEYLEPRALPTLGEWNERRLCPLARVRVANDDDALRSTGPRVLVGPNQRPYATAGELVAAASERGLDGLTLTLVPE